MKMQSRIPVFLSADDAYSPFIATTIASICDNTSSFIDVFVLDCGISEKNKNKIAHLKNKFQNFNIEWIPIDINKTFNTFIVREHFSKAMYGRLLIPELKPAIHKAIYTDVDVIFCGDIKALFDENLGNFTIGAVWEDHMESNGNNAAHLCRLGLCKKHKYFSSGLLLINMDSWRSNQYTARLFEAESKLRTVLKYPDQDLLNFCFSCNYKQLNERYCVTAPRARKHFKKGKLKDCVIRHFEGGKKPWLCHPLMIEQKKSNYIGKSLFWKYARMTEFYDELIYRFPIYRSFKNFKSRHNWINCMIQTFSSNQADIWLLIRPRLWFQSM